MSNFPTTIYDRPSLAASNLLGGDLEGAGRALVAPETLGPEKLTPLHERIFGKLKDMSKNDLLLSAIMKVATDPMVIIGLFMSSRFPVLAADKMFKVAKKFAGYGHRPGFLQGLFGRAEQMFAGTNIPDLMLKLGIGKDQFITKWSKEKVEVWLAAFKKSVGRYPTQKESQLLAGKLAGLDRAGWMHTPKGLPLPPLLSQRIKLSGPLQSLHDKLAQQFFPDMAKEVIRPMQTSNAGRAALKEFATSIEDKVEAFARDLKMSGATTGLVKGMTDKMKAQLTAKFYKTQRSKGLLRTQGALERGGIMSHGGPAGYFPHTLQKTPELTREYAAMAQQALDGDPEALARIEQMTAQRMVSGHIKPRFGILVPDMKAVESMGVPINKDAVSKMEAIVEARAGEVAADADKILFRIKKDWARTPDMPAQKAFDTLRIQMRSRGVMLSEQYPEVQKAMGELGQGNFPGFHEGMLGAVRKVAATRRVYSVDAMPVIQNYISSLASPYVWSVEKAGAGMSGLSAQLPLGEAIVKETGRLGTETARRFMKTDYIPILQGHLTQGQVTGMLRWSDLKMRAVAWLNKADNVVAKAIPAGTRTKLIDMITQERGKFSYLNSGGKLAGYFYFSALGFNPASAFQNLLQPVITTMPLVGAKAYWKGLNTSVEKLSGPKGYFALRAGGLDSQAAIAKVFPEYATSHLGQAPLSQSILRDALEGMWSTAAAKMPLKMYEAAGTGGMRRLKEAAMSMFTGSEFFNRIVTFEAGLAKARMDTVSGAAEGWKKLSRTGLAEAHQKYAASVVRATQFPAGPGQMPRALLKLSAPWRQFLYFPIRYAGFLAESTTYGGEAARNWGTIGRGLVATGVARQAAGAVGADVSRSLMMGALPLPQYEESPFFPLPLVPPVLSLGGAAAMSLATQDPKYARRASSLLWPGGVAGTRAYRTLWPKYAKYDQRTEDGKIPVYGENQALVGNFTPMQLFMRAVGVQPTEMSNEHAMTRYLLKHRDEIREARRQYVEAIAQGDAAQAQRVQDQFKQHYPSLGPIQVKKSDLKAVEDRRMMTRLQRILRTLPAQYRPMFQNVVNTAMAGQAGDMMGGAPEAEESSFLRGLQQGTGGGGSAYPGVSAFPTPYGDPASGFGAAGAGFGL